MPDPLFDRSWLSLSSSSTVSAKPFWGFQGPSRQKSGFCVRIYMQNSSTSFAAFLTIFG